jgi:signal-transduction protein with cAMP-binding, CBS, and nucleotidyltransferase domain
MTIARLIERRSPEIISCEANTTVKAAVALLAERRIGALPVLEGGRVVGIFSERDALYQLAQVGAAMLDSNVGDVMTAPPITVDPQTGVMDAPGHQSQRRSPDRLRFDRRSGQISDRPDRIRSRGHAQLYPVGLSLRLPMGPARPTFRL